MEDSGVGRTGSAGAEGQCSASGNRGEKVRGSLEVKMFDFDRFFRETPGKLIEQVFSPSSGLPTTDEAPPRRLIGAEVMVTVVDNNRHVWIPEARRSRMWFEQWKVHPLS